MSEPKVTGQRTLQVALNGDSSHPAMPRTAEETAADAAACVAAGANLLHLHAFDDNGDETLAEGPVARTITAVRARCPGVPISMTTFAQIEPDAARRLDLIASWTTLPDLIPANQGEAGIVELSALLAQRGVGVEACLLSVADAEIFVRRNTPQLFRRVVIEALEPDPSAALESAAAMEAIVTEAGVSLEQMHHGYGIATWDVCRRAAARGHGIRVGIEDTGLLPDGRPASGNVELVRAARHLL
ncbi:3-keto-5-aminohexanoate cleavage protein [Streptomyces parvulus]|uniref:Aldolase n=1 Tax=Streptomyces parvulus TaxID=146923 RepID=A0A369UZC0_9ACTN|nr:3-keto-5-aminohexanoate cleavage protein [Streptomyces parvulus]RDD85118.1 aldolase [Streptomyces parvulus]